MYLPTLALAMSMTLTQGPAEWHEPFPAHKIVGNTYYVGSKDLATYLITTPAGHILINSGFERTVPLIKNSVESLGFKMTDVKIILASHAHSDHVAGHAALQKLTGARVFVMRGDDEVIASGGKGQYFYPKDRWAPCKVDRILKDKDQVKLGGVTLIAHRTPGHTRGCTTWAWQVEEAGKKFNVVVIGSPNVNPGYQLVNNKEYPEIADDFARTFAVLKSLPCDVFLGAHGGYYGMVERYELLKKGQKHAFVNPQGYKDYVAMKERVFRKTLEEQKEKAKRNEKAQDKKKHPHHHYHHALWELRDAHKELEGAKHDFGGHREKALLAIKDAIKQVEHVLKHHGDNIKGTPTRADLREEYKKYKHHPHIHHAIHELQHAHNQIKHAKHDFGGHREAALRNIHHAIHQLELILKHHKK